MKKRIAITGGIGSGKSTALKIIQAMGYPTFSCDEIYHEIIQDAEYIQVIEKEFPSCVIDGKIDRKLLADYIFSNDRNRRILNGISHPRIMARLEEKMQTCRGDIVFAEVPLLFEGGYENSFDKVIVLIREDEERIASLIKRDNADRSRIENRMRSQFSYFSSEGQARLNACNAILVCNNRKVEDLKIKIGEVISFIKRT